MNADRRPLCLLAGIIATVLLMTSSISACSGLSSRPDESVTIYSGRSRELIRPVLQEFQQETGIQVSVRYGNTAELAATILEEGQHSPADVFFAQAAGVLGSLASEQRLTVLAEPIVNRVHPSFRSEQGFWVATSGRARVVVFNTERVTQEQLPDSILGFAEPIWKGRVGWAPMNASFQSSITAMRKQLGDDTTRQWLQDMQQNQPRSYPNNTSIVDAVGRGEVDVGFVNHYYLFRFQQEHSDFSADNYYLEGNNPGALVNVAGVGILNSSSNQQQAEKLVTFLLSDKTQQYFASETYEYPLVEGVEGHFRLPEIDGIQPDGLNLGQLHDLQATLQLMRQSGVLE